MKKEITRFEPWSAVRVGFFFGLLSGFLFGLFNGFFIKLLAGTSASSMLPPDVKELSGFSGGAMIALAIVMGLIFSLLYALIGAFGAMFYNVIAGLFGGLEYHVSGDSQAQPEKSSDADDEGPRHE